MKIGVVKQYSIFMPNRPGALARLAKLFGDSNINIIGIESEVRDDSGMVRVAVDGEADHSAVLSKAGFASVESRLLSVELEDKPGQLARLTKTLAEHGVNITNVYGTSFGNRVSRLLFAVENTDDALKLLQEKAAS